MSAKGRGTREIEEDFSGEVIPELHFELVGTCQTEDRQVGGKTQKTCSVLKTTWGKSTAEHALESGRSMGLPHAKS